MAEQTTTDAGLRGAVRIVAMLNLGYFGIEFAVAAAIGSVSLFADSVDFLEDASVNLLIAVALGWTTRNRARLGMALAGILLVPGIATIWTAWAKFAAPSVPAPIPLSVTGFGALAVNLSCAFILARYRDHQRQPDARGVPVGAERCAGECRHHRRRGGDSAAMEFGLAGPGRRSRHSGDERGRCPRNLDRRAAGASRC